MKPRRDRWVSIPDVAEQVLKRTNKIAERLKDKPRRAQLQAVRRLVLRAERRDEVRLTKRVSGDIYVKFDAIESLLPTDAETVTRLEVAAVEQAQQTRHIRRQLGDTNSRVRDHEKRIKTLEEEQELTSEYLVKLQAIRSRV